MQEPALRRELERHDAEGAGAAHEAYGGVEAGDGDAMPIEDSATGGVAAVPVKKYPTDDELDEIRKVRPITAEDLGPGPFPGGFTLEQELEFHNYVPDPIIISEERCRELAEEARKYAEELFEECGEPTPEEWRAAAQFWEAVVNRKMPENPLWLD